MFDFLGLLFKGLSSPEGTADCSVRPLLRRYFGITLAHELRAMEPTTDGGGEPQLRTQERSEDVYALHVPVQGFADLDAALARVLAPEEVAFRWGGDGEGDGAGDGAGGEALPTTKRLSVSAAPPHLFVHLKRFSFDVEEGCTVKLNESFGFGEVVEFGGFDYSLGGVVMHEGSAASGHYFSYVRERGAERWWKFDDAVVDEWVADLESCFGGGGGASAIMLLYDKRAADELPPPPPPPPPPQDASWLRRAVAASECSSRVHAPSFAALMELTLGEAEEAHAALRYLEVCLNHPSTRVRFVSVQRLCTLLDGAQQRQQQQLIQYLLSKKQILVELLVTMHTAGRPCARAVGDLLAKTGFDLPARTRKKWLQQLAEIVGEALARKESAARSFAIAEEAASLLLRFQQGHSNDLRKNCVPSLIKSLRERRRELGVSCVALAVHIGGDEDLEVAKFFNAGHGEDLVGQQLQILVSREGDESSEEYAEVEVAGYLNETLQHMVRTDEGKEMSLYLGAWTWRI